MSNNLPPHILVAAQGAVAPAQAHVAPAVPAPVYDVATLDGMNSVRETLQYKEIMRARQAYAGSDKERGQFIASLQALNALPEDQRIKIAGQLLLDAAKITPTGPDRSLIIDVGGLVDGAKDIQFQFPGKKPEGLRDLLINGVALPNIATTRWSEEAADRIMENINTLHKKHSASAHQHNTTHHDTKTPPPAHQHTPNPTPARPQENLYPFSI